MKTQPLKTLLNQFKQSLKSDGHDFTQGPLQEAVVLLAVPMILEIGLESVFALVDMFFVSRLGQNAIATVGLTESVVTIIYSIAIGMSTGATAIVARRIGEKNPEKAANAGAQAILLSILVSIIVSFLGATFAGEILHHMGASVEVIQEGTVFARIMLGGSLPILLLFLINGIFRGAGDAAMAMKSLWVASGCNILLCPIFINMWGLKGAAIATVVGRSLGVAYQTYHLFRGDGVLKLRGAHFKIDFSAIRSIVTLSWPASIQFMIGSGSWILITRLVAQVGGTAATAGCQIAFRNFVFFILPAWGLSNAAATLVGQNLGAQKLDRAEQSVFITARLSATLMFAVTLIFVFFSRQLVGFFTDSSEVLDAGVRALQILGLGFVFYGVGMVFTQALNGAGQTKTPTWISFFCTWVFQIPLAYYLAYEMGFGANGAIVAIPVSQALLAAIAWRVFERGDWKFQRV